MLKTICQIILFCCIPMLSGKENAGQNLADNIIYCMELENFERQEYTSIEGKCVADTQTLLEVQKELELLPDKSFSIRIENGNLDTSILAEQMAGCWQQYRMKNQYVLSIIYAGKKEKGKDAMMLFCSLMEGECMAKLEKELTKKGSFPSYVRMERINGLDIYTFCIYNPGKEIDGEESYEEEFLVVLNGTWEGQEVCWQYVTFPATGKIYDNSFSYQYTQYPPYDKYAAMKVDINYDGCADIFIRESIPPKAAHSMQYHGIVWKEASGKFVWYESFPKQVSHVEFAKKRVIYHYDLGLNEEYITEYKVVDGEYKAVRELIWKDETVFYYEMGVLVREYPNMGYTDKYELYPDLDYWWKG